MSTDVTDTRLGDLRARADALTLDDVATLAARIDDDTRVLYFALRRLRPDARDLAQRLDRVRGAASATLEETGRGRG